MLVKNWYAYFELRVRGGRNDSKLDHPTLSYTHAILTDYCKLL